jgi:hypothetical protein
MNGTARGKVSISPMLGHGHVGHVECRHAERRGAEAGPKPTTFGECSVTLLPLAIITDLIDLIKPSN